MRFLLAIFLCLLCAGCATSASKRPEGLLSETATRLGIPREEVTAIAASAEQAHKLVVVFMTNEGAEKNTIVVFLAEKRHHRSGLWVHYKKTETGWVEVKDAFGGWDAIVTGKNKWRGLQRQRM